MVDIRILVVGNPTAHVQAVLARLFLRGYGSHRVATVREAVRTLGTFHYDVVLAHEVLPDGRGYELVSKVEEGGASLLIAVALSEKCLWLPAVERGSKVLGERALNSTSLEWDIEEHLTVGAKGRQKVVEKANWRPTRLAAFDMQTDAESSSSEPEPRALSASAGNANPPLHSSARTAGKGPATERSH